MDKLFKSETTKNYEAFDVVSLLAVIHHICITESYPLSLLAESLAKISKYLIIEFVNEEDEMTARLIKNKRNKIHEYNEKTFCEQFAHKFNTLYTKPITSTRTLHLMRKRV